MSFIYYLSGKYVPAGSAGLPLTDLGLQRGFGVFDFLRSYQGKLFHLEEHVERLVRSADQIDLELPNSADDICDIVRQTLQRNKLAMYGNEVDVRIVVTGGQSSDSFTSLPGRSNLFVMVSKTDAYTKSAYKKGVKVITVDIVRPMPTVLSMNYMSAMMAMRKATKCGASEAIYLHDGCLTEATQSNFIGVKGNTLITADHHVLDGITCQVILGLAAAQGFDIERRSLYYDEVDSLDEAFLTSSAKEVVPVTHINNIVVGKGKPGPVGIHLLALFRAYAANRAFDAGE